MEINIINTDIKTLPLSDPMTALTLNSRLLLDFNKLPPLCHRLLHGKSLFYLK